ncbi:MAG: TadE/TadG family type IV pilus assembly protein, partial [Pseudolabrys sp.]
MATIWNKFRHTLQRFGSAREGNVAIIFALATLPIIASVGAAVDYSRANAVKADMQAALDSTALMLSKEAASDTVDGLQAKALTYFKAIFNPHGAENVAVSASYSTTNGSTLVLNGSVDVPTDFMQAFGYDTVTIHGSSTAQWGTNRLRVALVLDNTGSMSSSGKM